MVVVNQPKYTVERGRIDIPPVKNLNFSQAVYAGIWETMWGLAPWGVVIWGNVFFGGEQ